MYDTSIELIKHPLPSLASLLWGKKKKRKYSCQQGFHPTHEREISELDTIKGVYVTNIIYIIYITYISTNTHIYKSY